MFILKRYNNILKIRNGLRPFPGKSYPLRIYFTLLELLILLSIIIILASLLMPALRKAKEATYRIECASNLKQMGLALDIYRGDYNDYYLLGYSHWYGTTYFFRYLLPYMGTKDLIHWDAKLACPSLVKLGTASSNTYGYNTGGGSPNFYSAGYGLYDYGTPRSRKGAQLQDPSGTMSMMDARNFLAGLGPAARTYNLDPNEYYYLIPPHEGYNMSYCDGHANLYPAQIPTALPATGRFWTVTAGD